MIFEKDLAIKQLHIIREFRAPIEKVWRAWTEPELMDKWWAPKPYKAITEFMDFTPGGYWLFCMAGPNGDKGWLRVNYKSIEEGKGFVTSGGFCDEDGNIPEAAPVWQRKTRFRPTAEGTEVEITVSFEKIEDLEKQNEGGVKEGFIKARENQEELLAK